MKTKFLQFASYLLLGSFTIFTGCSDDDETDPVQPTEPEEEERITTDEIFHANIFASDALNTFYYWNEETAEDIKRLDPNTNQDPIKTVAEIKYHEGDVQIDKWTSLHNNMKEFTDQVGGVSTTYGYFPMTYLLDRESKRCISAVTMVYKDSPAQKAGLKRGDIIYKINGRNLTTDNFYELFQSSQITLSLAKVENNALVPTGKDVFLQAVKMYEDPILLDSIYEINGKKVGYLAYNNFDSRSIEPLVAISKKFKAAGVKELILDFRYNGGGLVLTENVMASMYVPEEAVIMKKVFEKEKYNDILTDEFKKQGESMETRLTTEFYSKDLGINVSTKDANIGLEKVYGLITRNSASASEALLSGLMPYVDVELIGEQSHGKYCTGWMMTPESMYKKFPPIIEDWGIYVMVAIYQNALGETPCMPNGLTPNIEAIDDPMLPTQLGDVNENMLKEALKRAGKTYPETKATRSIAAQFEEVESPKKATFGKRILLPEQIHITQR